MSRGKGLLKLAKIIIIITVLSFLAYMFHIFLLTFLCWFFLLSLIACSTYLVLRLATLLVHENSFPCISVIDNAIVTTNDFLKFLVNANNQLVKFIFIYLPIYTEQVLRNNIYLRCYYLVYSSLFVCIIG